MTRKSYPSDLSDAEWPVVAPLIPPAKTGGRHRSVDMREIVNGLFYINRTGCSWRALPHDLPAWSTVHHSFRMWRKDGTWKKIQDRLREKVRLQEDREATPSAAILDSQSVKTTEKGGCVAMTAASRSRDVNAMF